MDILNYKSRSWVLVKLLIIRAAEIIKAVSDY